MYTHNEIEIEWLKHAGFRIRTKEGLIYIDPYHVSEKLDKADVIFITHSHYDHLDESSLRQLCKPETTIFCAEDCKDSLASWVKVKSIESMLPGDERVFGHLKVQAFPAYNLEKPFHPKDKNWLGFFIEIEKTRLFFLGDTDPLPEHEQLECDIAFFPVSGIYVMDAHQAAALAKKMQPKVMSFPMHWGTLVDDENRKVGTKEDAETFCKESGVPSQILESIT